MYHLQSCSLLLSGFGELHENMNNSLFFGLSYYYEWDIFAPGVLSYIAFHIMLTALYPVWCTQGLNQQSSVTFTSMKKPTLHVM